MTLYEVSIRRPVLAIVMSLVLCVLGGVGFWFLSVREFPAVDPPVVTVSTSYPGAHAAVVDSQITEPLEQAVSGIAGIRTIASTSREGRSQIRVEFNIEADVEAAANDVRDKVAGAVGRLPADVEPPVVEKADADSEVIIFATLRSETRSILEVSNYASTVIKERVQTIPGVSTVRIFGEKRYAMRLLLDSDRMMAHGVTPSDIQAALQRENVDLPAGRIEGVSTELSLRTQARLTTPEEFSRLVIRRDVGRTVELRDVATVELGAENVRTGVKKNGVPMIGVALIPGPNTNAIDIANEYYRRVERIQKELPPDLIFEIGFDFTTFVRDSISEATETLFVAFLLVGLVIFLFLRDWRTTLVPLLAIPVSIVASFFVMYILGYSINILTLVGVILSIGLVCDDAIVVLENIYAKIEEGRPPMEAALEGTREIYFAVLSTTASLAAVFLPIVFLQGLTGRLFREFGIVVVTSVIASAFVALTLTPMMCRVLLRPANKTSGFYAWTEPFFEKLASGYVQVLGPALRRPGWAVALVVLMGGAIAYLVRALPSELAPLEDRSNVRISVRTPEGSTFAFTEDQLDRLGVWVNDNIPESLRTFSITAIFGGPVNTGIQNVYLKPPEERERSQAEVFQQIAGAMPAFRELRAFPFQPPTIGSRFGGQPVQYVVQAPNIDALTKVVPVFLEKASASPMLRFVDSDFKIDRPELEVSLDRERAAALGVAAVDIGRAFQLTFSDQRYGYFIRDGKQYDVIGQLNPSDRDDPGDLRRLHVRGRDGRMVSLDQLVRPVERTGPSAIYRFDRYVSATISAGLAPGATLGQAIDELDAIAKETLPEGFSHSLAGQSRDFMDSSSTLLLAFILALVLIYLTLAGQFESFVDPLIILVTVPLSLGGALWGLHVFSQSLNVFSQIGLIMLVGLVTKNGILILELGNQGQHAGLSKIDATVAACRARLRPILMTSLTTILGILPIALAMNGGGESRQSMGIAVVTGLFLATGLTLFVVPAIYAMFSRAKAPAIAISEGQSPLPQ